MTFRDTAYLKMLSIYYNTETRLKDRNEVLDSSKICYLPVFDYLSANLYSIIWMKDITYYICSTHLIGAYFNMLSTCVWISLC